MDERRARRWTIVQAFLLLLPVTLLTGLIVFVSYPAYPIPNLHPLQVAFDIAMLVMIAAIVAAWRLSAGLLRGGKATLGAAHGAWLVVLGAGALAGLIGAAIAIEHLMNPDSAALRVGFALLAPGVLLVPPFVLLYRLLPAGSG